MNEIHAIERIGAMDKLETIDITPSSQANSGVFTNYISVVDSDIKAATDLMTEYSQGSNIAVHDVMLAMEKAKLSLQTTIEIRNKLVESYKEITSMQI
ncbi:flagellar hook-basal body complex protein FliE [Catenovulum sediminis]|uniref:flagellar hook-basal body complex protein FliE n=1 Tax=Catenovulum sediminis TaxID=1740262 RepID=UPI00163D81E6|nr:flagellar hook-basal body complex protein FliE [Catenovulum sediminis]